MLSGTTYHLMIQKLLTVRLQQSWQLQATMVATWLTELWLDRINRALLEEGGEAGEEHPALTAQLRAFLAKYVETLDAHTTSALLASYGRMDDLVHFATCRQVTFTPSLVLMYIEHFVIGRLITELLEKSGSFPPPALHGQELDALNGNNPTACAKACMKVFRSWGHSCQWLLQADAT